MNVSPGIIFALLLNNRLMKNYPINKVNRTVKRRELAD